MGRESLDVAAEKIAKYGGPPMPLPKSLDDLGPIFARWPIMLKQDVATGHLQWRYIAESARRAWDSIDFRETIATYRAVVGNKSRNMLRIDGFTLPAVKVAWLLHYGEWPKGRIVWRNGDTADDRIENLEVKADQPARGRERIRPVGVARCYDRWQAYVRFPDGRQKGLGVFKTEEEAIAARKAYDGAQDLF